MGGSLPVYILMVPAIKVEAFVASICPPVIVYFVPAIVRPFSAACQS